MSDVEVTHDMLKNIYEAQYRGFQKGVDMTLLFIRQDPNRLWYTTAIKVNPFKNDGSLMLVTTYKDRESPLDQLERTLEDDHLKGAVASNPVRRRFDDRTAKVGK